MPGAQARHPRPRVTRLIDAYQAEVIDLHELAERRRRIDDHGRMLRARVREIDQQRTERTAELQLLEGVEACCASIREAMEEPSFTGQQKVLPFVAHRIVVEDRQVIMEHVVPTGPVRLQPEQQRPKKVHFRAYPRATHAGEKWPE
jgi:hypothetical protein